MARGNMTEERAGMRWLPRTQRWVYAVPRAFLDENGRVIIVGFDSWNTAAFVDADRAFPDSWTPLVPQPACILNDLTVEDKDNG